MAAGSELYTQTTGVQTLTASVTRTLLRLATASTNRLAVVGITCGFNGTTAVEPVCVQLCRFTAGTPTASSGTPIKYDPADGAAATTSKFWVTASEETATDIIDEWLVSPNGGLLVIQYPLGREPVAAVSTVIGVRAITASGVTPNVRASITWSE